MWNQKKRGNSYIAKRHSKTNDKYMENYNPAKPSIYIPYLDVNNLYGCGMSGYYLQGGIKCLENADNFDLNSIIEKSPIAYIVKVYLEYPGELHVLHNDYPLAPEKLAIPYHMLSDYYKKLADKYEKKVGDEIELIPNLSDKTNCVLHYKNLQLYLSLGMKLTKIQKVLKFKQSDWMKNILILTLKNKKCC